MKQNKELSVKLSYRINNLMLDYADNIVDPLLVEMLRDELNFKLASLNKTYRIINNNLRAV